METRTGRRATTWVTCDLCSNQFLASPQKQIKACPSCSSMSNRAKGLLTKQKNLVPAVPKFNSNASFGKKGGGRHKKFAPEQEEMIAKGYGNLSIRQLMDIWGCSDGKIRTILQKHGVALRNKRKIVPSRPEIHYKGSSICDWCKKPFGKTQVAQKYHAYCRPIAYRHKHNTYITRNLDHFADSIIDSVERTEELREKGY